MTSNDLVFDSLQRRVTKLEQQMDQKDKQLLYSLQIVQQLTDTVERLVVKAERANIS